MQRLLLKFAILSVSLLLTSAYAISICIPVFTENFKDYSASSIEMLVTIPAFSVMVMMLLSDFIAGKLGKKRTVQLGLLIVFLSVFLSIMSESYVTMLFSRIILGVGLGLINALAVSLIADFFTGNECATMMGVRSAFEGLGQSLLTYIAGLLFVSGWRDAFYIYFAAIPILIIFTLFVPAQAKVDTASAAIEEKSENRKLPFHVLPHCFILLFTVLVSVGFYVKLFDVLADKNLNADPEYVNGLFTALAFCSMAGGCVFGFLYAKLKFYSLQLGLIATALSCVLLAISPNMFMVTVSCVLNGLAYPLIIAYIFSMVGKLSVNASTVMVTSFMLIGCNIGAMVTPWGYSLISTLTGGGSASVCFIVCGVVFVVFAVLAQLQKSKYTVE